MIDLQFQFLVAAPNLPNQDYQESVYFLFSHASDGVLGLALNKPFNMSIDAACASSFKDGYPKDWRNVPLFQGGSRSRSNMFALHSGGIISHLSSKITDDFTLTQCNMEMLGRILHRQGPKDIFLAAGYQFWTNDQINEELDLGYWGRLPFKRSTVFAADRQNLWPHCRKKVEEQAEPGRPFVLKEKLAPDASLIPRWTN